MRRRLLATALLCGAAGSVVPLVAGTGHAQPVVSTQWTGTATADGTRVGVTVNDFLVVSNVVDAGGPVAQASVSALQGSSGLAATPYPGEIVLTAHGLSQGAAPSYPLIAQSNNANTPNADASHGPYVLTAHSTDDTSTATAQSQAGGSGSTSVVKVVHDPASGVVTSDAETTTEGFSVNGVLHIGRVHSHAHLVVAPGAPPQRTADTEFGDVTVGGQEVGITDKGLVLAGTQTPLPPSSTADALLQSAGVTVDYVDRQATGSALVAPGVAVRAQQNVPGVGLTTVTYWLGQAAVTAASPGTGTGATSLGGSAPGTSSGGAGGTTTTAAAAPSLGGTPVTSAGGTSPGVAPVTAPPGPPNGGYRLAAHTGPSSQSLYAVLALGAIVMVGAAQVFRVLAVRLTWT